ncbi:MAG: DUF4926 domain-containing protein [Synechococcus sp.]|nr:DUF4926 domain-containing protein [Synechococcus sp.]
MKFELFTQVTLLKDYPQDHLQRGDIATIVEHHPVTHGEDGYSLEVFNAIGETIAVITVAESDIQPLGANEVLHVRLLEVA